MDKCREEFEKWFLSTPTGKALSAANLDYYIFERQFDEYRDRDVEMAHRGYAYQQAKVDELQKRVDRALESIRETCDTSCNLATDDYYYLVEDLLGILNGKIVEEVEQALKGEWND